MHQNNSTQYCNTETVFAIFPFLQTNITSQTWPSGDKGRGGPIECRIWSIERRHFQWPWTTPTPGFKVTLFFDAKCLRNGTRYRHSFNGILIGTYIRPIATVSFRMTFSDLAKYSMTQSIVRPLCDSRATCVDIQLSSCISSFQTRGRPNRSTR